MPMLGLGWLEASDVIDAGVRRGLGESPADTGIGVGWVQVT